MQACVRRSGMRAVTEHGEPVADGWWIDPLCGPNRRRNGTAVRKADCTRWARGYGDAAAAERDFDACCVVAPTASVREPTADTLALFHYAVKSRTDFEAKMARGGGKPKAWDYWDKVERCVSLREPTSFGTFRHTVAACSDRDCHRECGPRRAATEACGRVRREATAGEPMCEEPAALWEQCCARRASNAAGASGATRARGRHRP